MEQIILIDAINILVIKDFGVDTKFQNILDEFPNQKLF